MAHKRTTSAITQILATPGHSVKGRIIASGLRLADLAEAAGIAASTLSDYLAGRIRNIHGQLSIMLAWCSLAGRQATLREFWGGLLARDVA